MATLLTHAALPLIARRAVRRPELRGRRLAVLSVVCACLPDLDVLGYPFGVRPPMLLGHRGLTHSLPVAAAIALTAALLGLRGLGRFSPAWWRALGFLFAATAAHGLVDTLTNGEVGVALLAPFHDARYLAPLHLLPASPLGGPEVAGRLGLVVLANEALWALAPAALLAEWLRPGARRRAIAGAALAWAGLAMGLRTALPHDFSTARPRPLRAVTDPYEDPQRLPPWAQPPGGLLTRLGELREAGLFGRELAAEPRPWSSSFFPWWYGGEAGRWQEGTLPLIGRTLFGAAPPDAAQARAWLEAAARGDPEAERRLFTLAPTEKLDLAYGALDFPRTRASLKRTHNGHPRYWFGRCNGIGAAAMALPEPFRVVELVGPGGRVRLHPNDVKALLAVAYYATREEASVGGLCRQVSLDDGGVCSMNPAGLVLVLLNVLGREQRGFLMDAVPTRAIQYYPVAAARVDLRGEPRPYAGEPAEPALAGRVAALVDVEVALTLSSTELSYGPADRPDPQDPTRYQRVGLRPEARRYPATLALGPGGELLGGRWTGDPPNGPDDVMLVGGGPRLQADGVHLAAPEVLAWPLIRALARASVEEGPALPVVDLRTACDGPCPP